MRQVRISGKKLLWGNKDHLKEALSSIVAQSVGSRVAQIKDDPYRLLQLFDIELSLVPNLDNRDVLIFDSVTLLAITLDHVQVQGPGGGIWNLDRKSVLVSTMQERGERGYVLLEYKRPYNPNYHIPPPIQEQVNQIEQGLKPHVSSDPSTWTTGAFQRKKDPLQKWTPFSTKMDKENPGLARSLDGAVEDTLKDLSPNLGPPTEKTVNSNLGSPVEVIHVVPDFDAAERALQEGYPLKIGPPLKIGRITTATAWNMRTERGIALPTDSEYENPRVLEIARREKELFDEIHQLDTELKELCQDSIPPK